MFVTDENGKDKYVPSKTELTDEFIKTQREGRRKVYKFLQEEQCQQK